MLLRAKTLLVLLSVLGWTGTAARKTRLPFGASCALAVSGICLCTTLCGMGGFLSEGAAVLYAGGLLAAAYCLTKKDRFRDAGHPGLWLLAAAVLILYEFTWGKRFAHEDTWGHWGLLTRHLLADNVLPSFKTPCIHYQDYPVGAGCFVYFFCRFTSDRESFQILAQMLFICMLLLPLTDGLKGMRKLLCAAVIPVGVLVLFHNPPSWQTLQVDNLLGVLAGAAFIVQHRCGKDLRLSAAVTAVMGGCLVMVKSSGTLFALFLVLCFLRQCAKNGELRKRETVFAAVFPFACLFLWKKHTAMVYSAPEITEHAVSWAYYSQVIAGKSFEDICATTVHLLAAMFTAPMLWLTAAAELLTLAVCPKEKRGERAALLGYAAAGYAVYQLGLLLVYCFSMSRAEALRLASYERYNLTFLLSVFLPCTAAVLSDLGNAERFAGKQAICFAAAFALCAAALPVCGFAPSEITATPGEEYLREAAEEYIAKYDLNGEQRILVVSQKSPSMFCRCLRYLLDLPWGTADFQTTGSMDLLEKYREYDVILVYNGIGEEERAYLENVVLADTQSGVRVCGLEEQK